ncbi:MAG: hypothetical protein ACQ5SW_05820, partial [Sphaerochaetaceae bacterium]
MKRNNVSSILLLLLSLVLLTVGCKEETQVKTTNLKLLLASDQFPSERSLIPNPEKMVINDYHRSGTGPQGQTFSLDCLEHAVDIGNLTSGRWTIEAVGYNAEGTPLVTGTITTMLSKATNTATLHLTNLVGTGSLSTLVTW